MSIKAMKWAYGLFEIIDIPPAERAVLLALCWDHTEKDGCYPSQDRVSLISGYRVRRVHDLLKSLETTGLISRNRVKVKGKWAHTSYRLFGSISRETTGGRGPMDHRLKKAGRNHRRTGADYRGNNNKGDVVDFSCHVEKKFGGVS